MVVEMPTYGQAEHVDIMYCKVMDPKGRGCSLYKPSDVDNLDCSRNASGGAPMTNA